MLTERRQLRWCGRLHRLRAESTTARRSSPSTASGRLTHASHRRRRPPRCRRPTPTHPAAPRRSGAPRRCSPWCWPRWPSPSSPCRSSGCCGARRGRSAWAVLTDARCGQALRLSIVCSLWATGAVDAVRRAAGVAAGPRRLPRARRRAGAVHAVDGAAAGGRRRRAVLRVRTPRPVRPVPRPLVRLPPAVHHRRRSSLAQTFVAMPFLVLTVEAALRQLDRRFEDAARTLGGSRWYTFRRVTLPAVRPALIAGAVLAWARALGEFGATITFAGNFPGTHADDAAGDLPRPRDRPVGGARAQPGADRACRSPCSSGCASGGSPSGATARPW